MPGGVKKRVADVVLGTALAVLALPVIALLAVAVACRLRCFPFFVHTRLGRGGRPFRFWKLRTLPVGTPPYELKTSASSRPSSGFSSFLRNAHLDELPQLLLVPFGALSLVGPRPKMPDVFEPVEPEYRATRLRVRQGCTGLWQISPDVERLPNEVPEYDAFYVEHATLRLDLWILWRTVLCMTKVGRPVRLEEIPRWLLRRPRPVADTAVDLRHRAPASVVARTRASSSLDIGVFGARGIPSTYGGYETFLTVLLPELAARGHRVTMYCRRGESRARDYRGVSRVVLPAIDTKQLSTLSHGLVAGARSRLARHDVVLSVNVANAPVGLLLRGTGQRVVMNTDGQEWLRGKWGTAAQSYFRLSARMAGLSASALVSDSEAMRIIYRDDFGADSTVIPYCWTELDSDLGQSCIDDLGLSRGRYFLVAARLNPENNVDRVVEAYVRSRATAPLVVLGAANYQSPVARRIERLASENSGVKVVGHVGDRAGYAALVRGARAYVHAHSVGGINPSLLEAMGCGARVFALSTPFNREALGDGGSYFDDFEQLAQLLIRADAAGPGDEPADDHHLRACAAARARLLFSRRRVADAYEALLLEVAHRPWWRKTTMPTAWSSPAEPCRADGLTLVDLTVYGESSDREMAEQRR